MVKLEFLTGATKNSVELMNYDALGMIVYYSSKEINHPHTKLLALDEILFIFHEKDYEQVLKDPLYVSNINKPLFLNSNPALESYIKHFQHVAENLRIKDFQTISNLNLMRQLILAEQGYVAVPKSLVDVHFNVPHIHTYKLSADLVFLSI